MLEAQPIIGTEVSKRNLQRKLYLGEKIKFLAQNKLREVQLLLTSSV